MVDCYRVVYVLRGDVEAVKHSILAHRACGFVETSREWVLVHLPLLDHALPAFLEDLSGWRLHMFSTRSAYGLDLLQDGKVCCRYLDENDDEDDAPALSEEQFLSIRKFVAFACDNDPGAANVSGWPGEIEKIYFDELRQMLLLSPSEIEEPIVTGPNEVILKLVSLYEPDDNYDDLLKAMELDPDEFAELFTDLEYVF